MNNYRYLLLCFLLSSSFGVGASGTGNPVDPTRPQAYSKSMLTAEQNQELSLSAIFITTNSKQAIINGLSYAEGETVFTYKVVSIRPNKVELNGPQGELALFINNNNVKKDADNGF